MCVYILIYGYRNVIVLEHLYEDGIISYRCLRVFKLGNFSLSSLCVCVWARINHSFKGIVEW